MRCAATNRPTTAVPTPVRLRSACCCPGLGACTAVTLRMYAEHQSWPLAGVDVELTYVVKDRNTRWIDRLITRHGVDEDQRAKLAEIAEKTRSPGWSGREPRSVPPPGPPDRWRRARRSDPGSGVY